MISYLSQSYCKKIVKEMKILELSIACSVIDSLQLLKK